MTATDVTSFRDAPTIPIAEAPTLAPARLTESESPRFTTRISPMRLLPMPASRESRGDRFIWSVIALGVAALYFYALVSFWAPANGQTDQNGYLVGGRQFAHTLSSGLKPDSGYAFIGHMWVMAPSGWNYPKYPLGLPILFSTLIWIFGERGYALSHLVSPVSATLATLGVFAITRRLSTGFIGVMAMLLLACGQVMLTLADNPNSHAACTCAVVWGVFFLFRWLETGAIWRGILAGGLFGFAYLIRYTEGLLILPLGVAMLYAARPQRPSVARLLITVGSTLVLALAVLLTAYFGGAKLVTAIPPLTPLSEDAGKPFLLLVAALSMAAIASMFIEARSLVRLLSVGLAWLVPVAYLTLFNMVAMHSFTSYASTNESTGFDPDFFRANWEKMVRVLADQGLFFIAPLGVLGLICMARRMPLIATLLTLWFVPSVLLYTAYYWAPDMMGVSYSRFVLTQLPALVVAAAWMLGEIGRRLAGRAVVPSDLTRHALASIGLAFGVAAIVGGMVAFDRRVDSYWWLLVPTGAVIAAASALSLLGRLSRSRGEGYARHLRGAVPRLAIATVVFISCSLGVYRTVLGSEWGQRIMVRANIEIQSRQNMNLAALGQELRRAIDGPAKERASRSIKDDADVVLFADGERPNHFQWIGGWQLFSIDAFNYDHATRMISQTVADANNPDPIDQSRVKFLQGVYKGKDQKALQADQNALILNSLKAGKGVFYVLPDNAGKVFERQLDRQAVTVKLVGSYSDVPSPRLAADFLLPSERPKQPVNRFVRGNAFAGPNFLDNEKMSFRIGQVTLKPATTEPATKPATRPATKPAVRSTTTATTMP